MAINRRQFIKLMGVLSLTSSAIIPTLEKLPLPYLRAKLLPKYPGKVTPIDANMIKRNSKFAG